MDKKALAKKVGKAIARQRNHVGMTQTQVAEILQIEKETVSRLETGAISPTLTRLSQLSEAFQCPIHNFFWFEEAPVDAQAEIIADMLRTVPEEKRSLVVQFVADLVRVLK